MMDADRDLRAYLDRRFRTCDERGTYYAHQPIYGLRGGHCEPDLFDRYVRTYGILRALGGGAFETLLDVGAAEGYGAHLATTRLGLRAVSSDLSVEACRRAGELFSIPATAADARRLPFRSGSFDVVLCSETLEHLPDWEVALRELLRVARQALVITVPHEPEDQVEDIRRRGVRFGHVNRFELSSLDYLAMDGCTVTSLRLLARCLRLPEVLVEAAPRRHHSLTRYPPQLFGVYDRARPMLRRLFGTRAAAALIRLDGLLCRLPIQHRALLYVIWKPGAGPLPAQRAIPARELVAYERPLHRIDGLPGAWDWGFAPPDPGC